MLDAAAPARRGGVSGPARGGVGHDHPAESNVVDVYVGYLRRKIDQPFGRHTIETVRGIGFRAVDHG